MCESFCREIAGRILTPWATAAGLFPIALAFALYGDYLMIETGGADVGDFAAHLFPVFFAFSIAAVA